MAGHNKWSKVKHKKKKVDKKRSKIFSKLSKEITVAVKEGDSADPEFNSRLRVAIANAKGENMPKDNIKRAIKRGLDKHKGDLYKTNYEGYAPNGIAVFVECTTDNINRTVSNIREIFTKYGGNMSTSGSVDYLFERKGVFRISTKDRDVDDLQLELIDAGAEEIELDEENDMMTIRVEFEQFGSMQSKLESMSIEPKKATLVRLPKSTTALPLNEAKTVLKTIAELDDDEDVQNVFHNLEMNEAVEELFEELD